MSTLAKLHERGRPAVPRVSGLLFGGDYNPEQWPEETWLEDVELMREAGVNIVSIGIFSWALLEPQEGVYDFDWLDRVIELLWSNGISIDLATPSAAPPAWMARRYPETLPVTAEGVRLEFGSRRQVCPTARPLQEAIVRMAEQLAGRYGSHPALALWHVSNEYGWGVSTCYCDSCAAAFRRWLEDRYERLDELNRVWGTTFWGQRYGSFDEIEPPRRAPGSINPTQLLDWARFSDEAMLASFVAERDVLRQATPDIPITTNFMCGHRPSDYWKWARAEDVVTLDAYPDPALPDAHVRAAMDYDLVRSLAGGASWLLLEHAMAAVNWRDVNIPKRPGQMRLWMHQAIARGSDGAMFFQWRSSRAGAERFHSGMVPHHGRETRGWRKTVRAGREVVALAEVAGAAGEASVAILFDWENWWSLESPDHPSSSLELQPIVLDWYRWLHAENVAVDFAHPADDLDGYRLVLVPTLLLASDETLRHLEAFAQRGGTVVVGFFTGVVDENDHVRSGEETRALRELVGARVDEWWPLVPGAETEVSFADGSKSAAHDWTEWLELEGAEPVATYSSGDLEGLPAVTRNDVGEGAVYYCSARLDPAGVARLLAAAVGDAGVTPVADVPAGVEACRRHGSDHAYLFLLNHTEDAVEVPWAGSGAVELLSGEPVDGIVRLDRFGVAVIREA